MKKSSLTDSYLCHYAADEKWKLTANDCRGISQVVVIPAFAERDTLFYTLASLAKNRRQSLERTLTICVVNNKDNTPPEDIENNLQTIEYLDALILRKSLDRYKKNETMHACLSCVLDTNMKLGYINACSKGYEIPRSVGGVGMARKIGMDKALILLKDNPREDSLIFSLDADTVVRDDYLSAVDDYFVPGVKNAIVAYEHQMPDDEINQAAICCYEIFLRYWVLGLKYAKSRWAFHSVGSTMVVSAQAYLEVRGMNKREAGEDFYFLNKLAKISIIHYIKDTCVYPSARPSTRVPFGTGKSIQRFMKAFSEKEYCVYDPQVFSLLAGWLQLMDGSYMKREDEILEKVAMIHPGLKQFLEDSHFPMIWSRIRRTSKNEKTIARHFNDWFDGFRTLKLIHYLTATVYPKINMFSALDTLLRMTGLPDRKSSPRDNIPPLAEQISILKDLRKIT